MPETIHTYLTKDHRLCDETFAVLENAIVNRNYEEAMNRFNQYENEMLNHFAMEEKIVFPDFEASAHEGCNPVPVMVHEHDQMRQIMTMMRKAIEEKNVERFLGLTDSLMILAQQHNMKEEQIMYNLADQALANTVDSVLMRMKEIKASSTEKPEAV